MIIALVLLNLFTLVWAARLYRRCARLTDQVRASRHVQAGLAARVAAQAQLLARRAEK